MLVVLPALALSCAPQAGIKTITKTRVVSAPAQATPLTASSAERFGYQSAEPAQRQSSQGDFAWDTPPTWKEKPASGMRLASFTAGPADEAECYVIQMNADGGGLAANINRWREQMGQEPLSEDELAALPQLEMLGRKGTLVEIAGEYTAMSGQPAPGFMMLGVVCLLDDSSIFVKMTGPEAAVRAESDHFKAFCASLRLAGEARS